MKKPFWADPTETINDSIEIIEPTKDTTNKYRDCSYGAEIVRLKPEHIKALRNGKIIVFHDDEYATFLIFEDV